MTIKKILVLSYLFPNAVKPNHGIFVLNRLKAMSKYADVTVINPIPNSPIHNALSRFAYIKDIPEQEDIEGIRVYHPRFFSIPGHLKFIETFSYRVAINSVLKEIGNDFDLIDLHWTFPDLPTGNYLARRWDIPLHVTLRGMEAFHIQDQGIRKHIVSHYLKRVNKVISLSEEMANKADELAQTGPITTVIRNGVDVDRFCYMDKYSCRNRLGIAADEKIILGVGSLIYRKGFDLVIKGLNSILSQPHLSNTKFYILGSQGPEGDYRKELNEYISKYNLSNNVVFVGAIENSDLVYWYNAADVFCLSSRGEGSPNVLTEALSCGLPSVASNVGSVPEIISSEENLGYCVPNESIDDISDALIRVLSTDYNRKLQSKVFSKYHWDWCAQSVMKVIERS